jgi:hypothetical protein
MRGMQVFFLSFTNECSKRQVKVKKTLNQRKTYIINFIKGKLIQDMIANKSFLTVRAQSMIGTQHCSVLLSPQTLRVSPTFPRYQQTMPVVTDHQSPAPDVDILTPDQTHTSVWLVLPVASIFVHPIKFLKINVLPDFLKTCDLISVILNFKNNSFSRLNDIHLVFLKILYLNDN